MSLEALGKEYGPYRQEIGCCREEAALGNAKEEAGDDEALVRGHKTHQSHHCPLQDISVKLGRQGGPVPS